MSDIETDFHLAETETALGASIEDFICRYLVDEKITKQKTAVMLLELYEVNDNKAIKIVDTLKIGYWQDYLDDLAYIRKADKEVRFEMENR